MKGSGLFFRGGSMASQADVIIGHGWGPGRPIVWCFAVTEKGVAFLTAYNALPDDSDPDGVIEWGNLFPEQLDHFKRMAAAAGVKILEGAALLLDYQVIFTTNIVVCDCLPV
jgi:hypothetical protein